MEYVGRYLICVLSASIIVAIITSVTDGKGAHSALIRLVCGVFLFLVMLGAAREIDFSDIALLLESFETDGALATSTGEALAESSFRESIITRTRAYILDKAQTLGASLDVKITLGEQNTPEQISVTGSVSPYAKTVLTKLFTDDLGIAKENITWLS